jgi:hypothetical protein
MNSQGNSREEQATEQARKMTDEELGAALADATNHPRAWTAFQRQALALQAADRLRAR